MLADKDRIFTNLYGFQDWSLKAAQARGDWGRRGGTQLILRAHPLGDEGHYRRLNKSMSSECLQY